MTLGIWQLAVSCQWRFQKSSLVLKRPTVQFQSFSHRREKSLSTLPCKEHWVLCFSHKQSLCQLDSRAINLEKRRFWLSPRLTASKEKVSVGEVTRDISYPEGKNNPSQRNACKWCNPDEPSPRAAHKSPLLHPPFSRWSLLKTDTITLNTYSWTNKEATHVQSAKWMPKKVYSALLDQRPLKIFCT